MGKRNSVLNILCHLFDASKLSSWGWGGGYVLEIPFSDKHYLNSASSVWLIHSEIPQQPYKHHNGRGRTSALRLPMVHGLR